MIHHFSAKLNFKSKLINNRNIDYCYSEGMKAKKHLSVAQVIRFICTNLILDVAGACQFCSGLRTKKRGKKQEKQPDINYPET